MFDSLRLIIPGIALCIYLIIIMRKLLELQVIPRNRKKLDTYYTFAQDYKKWEIEQKKKIQFEIIRQSMECILFLCFMLTDTYSWYFRLFSFIQAEQSIIGYYYAWSILIILTLIISIAVDWLFLTYVPHRQYPTAEDRYIFFRRELYSFTYIAAYLAMILIALIIGNTFPSSSIWKFSFPLLLILVFHCMMELFQNKHMTRKPIDAGSLHEGLPDLLETHGIKSVYLITRSGRYCSTKMRISGLWRKKLEINQRYIISMQHAEIYAMVMQCLKIGRKTEIWKTCCNILMIIYMFQVHISATWRLISRSAIPGLPSDISRMISSHDAVIILILITVGIDAFYLFRYLRNRITCFILRRADKAVAQAGYREELKNGIIQAENYEDQYLPSFLHSFTKDPDFSEERAYELAHMKGDTENG